LDTNILLGDLNAEGETADIFTPATGNESLHKIENGNGFRVLYSDTSENVIVKITNFLHRNIQRYSSDWKRNERIDHVVIDKRRHSSVGDVRSFIRANCNSDHYRMIAKVRERGSQCVNKKRKSSIWRYVI
jgi:endonuclease/exonuclease/phosphatase family metal-dependent hydrolase